MLVEVVFRWWVPFGVHPEEMMLLQMVACSVRFDVHSQETLPFLRLFSVTDLAWCMDMVAGLRSHAYAVRSRPYSRYRTFSLRDS